jgi:anaphase-promoting complex subunit 3
MEIYSSVLWHLHREVELAHLTEEVLAMDRLSPAAW